VRRLALAAAAACLIAPGAWFDLVGLALFGAAFLWDKVAQRSLDAVGQPAVSDSDTAAAAPARGAFGRWLARRVAREEEEAAEEMAAEAGGSPTPGTGNTSLEAWLRDERISNEPPPADAARWSAWAVIAVATVALGYMGAHSWHATRPLAWLGALVAITVWLVGGLVLTLRPVVNAAVVSPQRA
jgi:hypothetical protein